MSPDVAGPARVVRFDGERWVPIGPVIPPVDDPVMHHECAASPTTWWHLPKGIAETGDRLVVRERAWEFRDRCGPNNAAVRALAHYWGVAVGDLLDTREVWSMRQVVPS